MEDKKNIQAMDILFFVGFLMLAVAVLSGFTGCASFQKTSEGWIFSWDKEANDQLAAFAAQNGTTGLAAVQWYLQWVEASKPEAQLMSFLAENGQSIFDQIQDFVQMVLGKKVGLTAKSASPADEILALKEIAIRLERALE